MIKLFLLCSLSLFSAGKEYLVKNVSGDVSLRLPGSVNWEKAQRGKSIPYSTLVEIGEGGKITFESGSDSLTDEVSLKSPMVVRLDENIVKKVKSESIYVPAVYADSKNSQSKTSAMFEQMSDAWQGFSAIMEKKNIPGVSSVFKAARTASEVNSKTKLIKLYVPSEQTTVKSSALPQDFKVQWKKVEDPDVVYEIKLWTKKDTTPTPIARTKDNFYSLKLPNETEYLLQVSTVDGKWKSSVRNIYLTHPIPKMNGSRDVASVQVLKQIPLVLPQKGFSLQTNHKKSDLFFQWEAGPPPSKGRKYSLTLLNEKGDVVQNITTEKLLTRITINQPGKYSWFVESKTDQIRSETRELNVEKKSDIPLDKIFAKRMGQVIYLENGM